MMTTDVCAYCGRPLQMVAGFCTACHAPVEIAARARLVAGAIAPQVAIPVPVPEVTPHAASPPHPALIPTRLLVWVGIGALLVALVGIGARLDVTPIPAWFPPADATLSVSLVGGDATVPTVPVGTPFVLRYGATLMTAATVTLTIAPQHGPARVMAEQWPRGISTRAQTLVALATDTWHITVARDGATLRALDLVILPPLSMTKESSRSADAFFGLFPSEATPGAPRQWLSHLTNRSDLWGRWSGDGQAGMAY